MKYLLILRSFTPMLFLLLFFSCKEKLSTEISGTAYSLVPSEYSGVSFSNDLRETENQNILQFPYYYNGGGVAVGDINNDGLPDIYFTGNMKGDQLYLNKGKLQFENITGDAGILSTNLWTTGVTFTDINNDGWLDIYVCRSGIRNFRNNLLYINQGNGKFVESAKQYGLNDNGYSVQASFFDFDIDGDLDLYLVNHSDRFFTNQEELFASKNEPQPHEADKLYRNNGDGSFTDISKEAGINHFAFGLSAAIADLNQDGLPDIYAASDFFEPDYFYVNQGDGTFTNKLRESFGHISFSSMGSDVNDINNDGLPDIIVCDMQPADNFRKKASMASMDPARFHRIVNEGYHYQYMQNTLQLNSGVGRFSDIAELSGLSETDWSWGPLLFDMDNDGFKDLFISNGIRRDIQYKDSRINLQNMSSAGTRMKAVDVIKTFPVVKIKNYSFKNLDGITFQNQSDSWGIDHEGFTTGAAYADLDADGDLDLVFNNIDDKASIYENIWSDAFREKSNYLQLVLKGTEDNKLGIGTVVKLMAEGQIQYQSLQPTRGFQSSVEPIIHFGLSSVKIIDKVEIRWPNGTYSYLHNIPSNQRIEVKQESTTTREPESQKIKPLFAEIAGDSGLAHVHQEQPYNDFEKETLLPHKYSQLGPCLVVGDVNGDKLDDVYVGGAKGYSGQLYIQGKTGSFKASAKSTWQASKDFEDVGGHFFDCDGDGDQDLYVASGGNEWENISRMYQDRLYINDGKGNFKRSANALPESSTSSAAVRSGDYDNDGDLDLFIGGRLQPGLYPLPSSSTILNNKDGIFSDVTSEIAKDLKDIGMVTDAQWTDFDVDGDLDLLIVGEWMPITFFENRDGIFYPYEVASAKNTKGWWYSLAQADLDLDGDMDYVAGNLGKNYKYQATLDEPFEVFADDFDDNGTHDIVLSYHQEGKVFPLRGRQCSSQQMPFIKEKFPNYSSFASSDLIEVYGQESIQNAYHLQANTFASVFIENLGQGQFSFNELPQAAQLSSVNGIIIQDFDEDGFSDILIAGNMFQVEVETARNDAGHGLFLKGNGENSFEPIPAYSSGFFAPGDVKNIQAIKQADGSPLILVANNNDRLQVFTINKN
ncbi:MAG: VCBS repeat-containing protein [Cyclobacteriaceae bacterium]